MKQHYSRYTPEMVERDHAARRRTSSSRSAEMIASTADADTRDDDPVRARLDAALGRLADDPHRRDGATAAAATSASPAAA